MMKKRLFVFMLLTLLIMGGCKDRNQEEQLAEEEIVFDFTAHFSLGKDGILYYSDLLYITDYATGVTVPLCDKPNCAHKPQSSTNENPQCNAAFTGRIEAAYIYHDKLYVFVVDGVNHTTVYMAETTGEGRRKIAEADYSWYGNLEFRDGKLYFSAERFLYEENNSLRQEKEVFIGSFDTNNQSFEILTTQDMSLAGINIDGITSSEFFFRRYTFLDDKRNDLTNISVEYIAKNLETGEERNFLEGEDIVNHIGDYSIVETGIYYMLVKGGTYEYWKKETDGDEIFIYSAEHLASFRPIINGEPLLEKDKSDFQKQLYVLCTCGDIVFVMDERKGNRHGIMTIENYLGNIDEIVYPEFPNMTYY